MSKCTACGAVLSKGSVFCDQCGAALRGDDVDGYNQPARGDDVDGYNTGAAPQLTSMTGLITPSPDRPTGYELKASPTLEPGQTFAGRYKIEKVIGQGGMGTVYKSLDTISGKPTALKLINAERVGGERAMRRLIEEGVTARDVRHPNVVAVYDVGQSDGQPFVAMEYLDGISLWEWHARLMQRGESVPMRVAARIAVEILQGLRAAHEAGVIHRDLKPENIILMREPTEKSAPLKLLDFGIARTANAPTSTSSTGIGTPDFMAPEQRTNPDLVGPAADLYSLSVLLYYLLVNALPTLHWQPPSGGRSDVPQEVDDLILKGMSTNRNLRPQSAEEYRVALISAVNRIPFRPVPPNNNIKNNTDSGATSGAGTGALIAWIVGGSSAALLLLIVVISALMMNTGPVQPDANNPFAYYSGEWEDGYGGYFNIDVSPNGSFEGSGETPDGTDVDIRGSMGGNALQYTLSKQGRDFANGQGVQTNQCHFNYETYNLNGSLALSGTFHVNHEAGDKKCP